MNDDPEASAPMVEVTNLHKYFGSLHVLRGLDAVVARGEVVSMMGPSGSGKSTFLRCMNRIEEPTSGSVRIDGTEIVDRRVDVNRIRAEIGIVFQHFNLFPHMTTLANVTLALIHVRNTPKAQAKEIAMGSLERVGLADKADARPPDLSGGQQQRVAIARSLAMRPKLLLFDEPTSALDPEMVHEVLDVMRDLVNDGMTMMIVSHEIGFLREASDRVLMLDGGHIIERGPPEQLFEDPQHRRTREFLRSIL